jgi:hypothetical protein
MKPSTPHLIVAAGLAIVGLVLALQKSPGCILLFAGATAALLQWKAVKARVIDL